MAILDLRRLDLPGSLEVDLCLVGGGTAAWAIASELRDSGLQILLLESGGSRVIEEVEKLNLTEDVGAPLFTEGRRRALGGTTEHTGWGNRCITYDNIDFEKRPWVPYSGWPFGAEEIEPYLNAASEFLGAGPCLPEGARFKRSPAGITPPEVDESKIRNVYWWFGRDETGDKLRVGASIRQGITNNIQVLVHATVTHLNTVAAGNRIDSVEVSDPAGRRFVVKAQAVVLCTGGIENARMLLASNRSIATGLGNQHDLVGRFLMDHPRDLNMAVTFDPQESHRIRKLFGPFNYDSGSGVREYVGGLALSDEFQRKEQLLNCAAWTWEDVAEDCPYTALTRVGKRTSTAVTSDVGIVLSQPRTTLRAAQSLVFGQPVQKKASKTGLIIGSEQRPDPDSRVTLSDTLDQFGVPIARTDWRIHEQERASQAALARLIGSEFDRLKLPRAILADWVANGDHERAHLVDGCHPISTTRMSSDPCSGVVDANCEVHGIQRLYLSGSSVFPTASHANPTLMIAALAMRLAKHLRKTIHSRANAYTSYDGASSGSQSHGAKPAARPRVPRGTKVAVTGATGFIGGRLVERLLKDGADVVCLARGNGKNLEDRGASVSRVDLSDNAAVRSALKGIKWVFHCAYNWDDEAWNMQALRSLIDACLANQCDRLVHVSSFVVYEVPSAGELTEEGMDSSAGAGYPYVKQQLEIELMSAVRDRGLAATAIQPTIVYGPGSGPWTRDVADMLRYGTVVLPGRGDGICNAVYADDVVSAMILAAQEKVAIGQSYLISGPAVTWANFYETMSQALDTPGPMYLSHEVIVSENHKVKKLRRMLAKPGHVLRLASKIGPGRVAAGLVMKVMPRKMRSVTRDRLYGPRSRQRGYVHVPDIGRMRWMECKSIVTCDKARKELGYRPEYDLAAGMIPTSEYLRNVYVKGAE